MKPLTWLIVIFVAWWIIHDPGSAAGTVQKIGHLATQAAGSAVSFLSSI